MLHITIFYSVSNYKYSVYWNLDLLNYTCVLYIMLMPGQCLFDIFMPEPEMFRLCYKIFSRQILAQFFVTLSVRSRVSVAHHLAVRLENKKESDNQLGHAL